MPSATPRFGSAGGFDAGNGRPRAGGRGQRLRILSRGKRWRKARPIGSPQAKVWKTCRRRLAKVGGVCEINSAPGKGTRVVFRIKTRATP